MLILRDKWHFKETLFIKLIYVYFVYMYRNAISFRHRMFGILYLINILTELMHVCHEIQYNSICHIHKITSYILFN